MSDLHDALRAWAKGMYSLEAGVELLIGHGKAIYEGAPWLIEVNGDVLDEFRSRRVMVDVDKLVYEAGAWSGSEQRLVDIAASMLSTEHSVSLQDTLSGLGRGNLQRVLAAVAHAGGSHEHSGLVTGEDGRPLRFEGLSSLYPWPGDDHPPRADTNPQPRDFGPLGGRPAATGVGPAL